MGLVEGCRVGVLSAAARDAALFRSPSAGRAEYWADMRKQYLKARVGEEGVKARDYRPKS